MNTCRIVLMGLLCSLAACAGVQPPVPVESHGARNKGEPVMDAKTQQRLSATLVRQHGKAQADRIRRGLAQVIGLWRPADGDAEALAAFARQHFVSDPAVLADTARRLEYAMEMLDGHAHEVLRDLSHFQSVDVGPPREVDALLAAYSPTAHLNEDLFRSKIAFVALLNFPITTLEQRLGEGERWSRQQWALARLTARFEQRVPAEVLQEIDRVKADTERYIDGYNIRMDRLLLSGEKTPPFPAGLRLISHWGLRDEIRGQYGKRGGLARQRLIARVMERIIRQEIPRAVIDSDKLEWDPERNRVRPPGGSWRQGEREADERYAHLSRIFQAIRRADRYFPTLPTHIHRAFLVDREMPEARLRELLESVLRSGTAREVAALIQQRLGRPLEAFDIWYTGFRPKSSVDETKLDAITRERYPDVGRFQADIPRLLGQLGFDAETAAYLGERIVVDPARGAGHADGAKRREDKAHLRTRLGPRGMDYKGFNIAIHELGHNVEQVFSMSRIDHTLLDGVPNTGFTEAFAFLFQAHDLELLGQATSDDQAEVMRTLDRFWSTFEIAGVAILDMELWHWMYAHPRATPAELRQAMLSLAREVWNRYYAPVLGVKDAILPAIYSHIIAFSLYTPDYPLGFLITSQVEQHLRTPAPQPGSAAKSNRLGTEMERMCRLGRLSPDIWMKQAVGSAITSAPLLRTAEEALGRLRGTGR